MAMAHTSGPWTWLLSKVSNPQYIVSHSGKKPGQMPKVAWVVREADAHLIAAAPDLLACLQEYLRDFGDNTDDDSRRMADKALAAIAKAHGVRS
jgi:hypothetical protein